MNTNQGFRIILLLVVVAFTLTCYFSWELMYQERAMLGILQMSKVGQGHGKVIAPGSRHLEEVAEAWFENRTGKAQ